MNDLELYIQWQENPLKWVCDIFNLRPQQVKAEHKEKYDLAVSDRKFSEFKAGWFEPFIKGEEVTWQQIAILLAVGAAVQKKALPRISVRSGHGIGKSTTLSWLLLWFLFCFKDSQIPCTAPTSDQMHDILWKEVQIWLSKMPKEVSSCYDWSNDYIRMFESPQTWFARARTARKEAPEALAGVHAEHVLYLVDEASGVPDEIFNTGEGALTGDNYIFVMISNPTRLLGYFFDSHHNDEDNWQTFNFNSEESPIVNEKFVYRIIDKHGINSDEYRIRVKGEFPAEDALDDGGYLPLLLEADIRETNDGGFTGPVRMGIDPAGEGDDTTDWVIRDNYKAKRIASEKISNPKSIAQKTRTLMDAYHVDAQSIWVDNFGEGANVAQELAFVGIMVNAVNVGDHVSKEEEDYDKLNGDKLFINLRAKAYWFVRHWLRTGAELVSHKVWKEQSTNIRYRTELSGRIKIMSKREMRREGIKSPNSMDALMLTFVDGEAIRERIPMKEIDLDEDEQSEFLYPSMNL
jgi:hypothetical protein